MYIINRDNYEVITAYRRARGAGARRAAPSERARAAARRRARGARGAPDRTQRGLAVAWSRGRVMTFPRAATVTEDDLDAHQMHIPERTRALAPKSVSACMMHRMFACWAGTGVDT